jgi:type II secretory pathway pseudopilin PulG
MGLRGQGSERGYAMAALLVSLAVMSVVMSAVLPVWRFQARREKEAELVFRGEQYARAVGLFARKNGGAFPPNIDVLVQGRYLRKKYKDPMVEDGEFQPLMAGAALPGQPQPGAGIGTGQGGVPGTGGGSPSRGGGRVGAPPLASPPSFTGPSPFQGAPGQPTTGGVGGGIIGVASKSRETSIMIYRGGTRYNEWVFRYAGLQNQPGAVPGQGMPGMPRVGPDGRPMPTVPGTPRTGRGERGGTGGAGGFGFPSGRGRGRGMRPPG